MILAACRMHPQGSDRTSRTYPREFRLTNKTVRESLDNRGLLDTIIYHIKEMFVILMWRESANSVQAVCQIALHNDGL